MNLKYNKNCPSCKKLARIELKLLELYSAHRQVSHLDHYRSVTRLSNAKMGPRHK